MSEMEIYTIAQVAGLSKGLKSFIVEVHTLVRLVTIFFN